MLPGLIVLHAVCGSVALIWRGRLGRRGLAVGALAPVAAMVWVIVHGGRIVGGDPITSHAAWVPSLGLDLDLRADAFSLLMIFLVAGIGSLVFAYAWSYFPSSARTSRVAGLLTLFAGSMLGLVVADNLIALYVFWELTSVLSYLLIGTDDERPAARAAAQHALLVTGLGGLVMLAGLVMLGQEAGTYRIGEIVAAPPTGTATAVAATLILIGAFTKSAQYPFHSWLPGAMVAPTPISAYLHSAAMVKAGVYLIARLAPALAGVGIWRPLVVAVGLTTMIAGGLRALRPFDLKQLLAFGTIAQLGFMVVLFGIGEPAATAAGCALLLAHGLFKASLFMVVGIVDHETGTRDIRELPTFGSGWRATRAVAVIGAASMAAVPLAAGFISKEQAYGAFIDGAGGDRLVLAGIVIGSVLTVAYSLRFAWALVRPHTDASSPARSGVADRAPGVGFVAPALVLTAMTVVFGVAPRVWSGSIDAAAGALDSEAHAHLVLWHGFTPALALSLATMAIGVALFIARRWMEVIQARLAPPVSGVDVYDAAVRGLLRFAERLTRIVQSGSLPVYAAVILATAAVAPMAAMATGVWWSGWPEPMGGPAHVPVAVLLVVGAIAATVTHRRFAAVILLGVVGYGMALLFALQGAPDLALTQFGVETLFVVVFLLVLQRLPDRFEQRPPARGRAWRLVTSAVVGASVVVMALAMAGARTAEPVSREMSELAYPEGDGRNVVNVILVDIRGMDTLGEITVVVAAAIGIVALARVGMQPRSRPRRRRSPAIDGGRARCADH